MGIHIQSPQPQQQSVSTKSDSSDSTVKCDSLMWVNTSLLNYAQLSCYKSIYPAASFPCPSSLVLCKPWIKIQCKALPLSPTEDKVLGAFTIRICLPSSSGSSAWASFALVKTFIFFPSLEATWWCRVFAKKVNPSFKFTTWYMENSDNKLW